MGARVKCPYCKEPRGGRPLQRGTGFHQDCYEDAMREQERKKEAKLISRAARDQYWDRWVRKVRVAGEPVPLEATAMAVVTHDKPSGRFATMMAGRLFEDAAVPSRE
jgi:hypothetical protein